MRTNPENGAAFAMQLVNGETGSLVDIERVRYANPLFDSVLNILLQAVDIFTSQNMIQPATSFLLDALEDNKS
jgi:clathrin heavy chain